jgi:hypothetical protein
MRWARHIAQWERRDYSEDLDVDGMIDNIRMDVKEIGWEVVDWILLNQGRD